MGNLAVHPSWLKTVQNPTIINDFTISVIIQSLNPSNEGFFESKLF